MYIVQTTHTFDEWLENLKDQRVQGKIMQRVLRIESGLLGDWKTVGAGVSELRIDYGPGYRLYYTLRDRVLVILLCGSDKKSQNSAIATAKELAKRY